VIEPAEIAWLAGLFDGEGSAGIYKQVRPNGKSWYRATAQIAMTHAPTIARVRKIVGYGGLSHLRDKRRTSRLMFRWTVACAQAREFLRLIRPYSITKAEQIDAILEAEEFRRLHHTIGRSGTDEAVDQQTEKARQRIAEMKLVGYERGAAAPAERN
jgi:hypothetical protein